MNKKQRLSKFLAASGVASRRACEELIFDGRVIVNQQKIFLPQTLVDEQDDILVDGKPINKIETKVYFMLNKPKGFLCSNSSSEKSKKVLDLFNEIDSRLFTVGRLDKDTEGLLLVTNDGHFANKVIHPSNNINKEYLVKTDQEINAHHLTLISQGTYVQGTFVKPLRVLKVRKGTLKITVGEGKKHEVRMLLAFAGLNVNQLTRIRIGGLMLGKLPVGQFKILSEGEREAIFGR